MPQSCVAMTRATARLVTMPRTTPKPTKPTPMRIARRRTSRFSASSALRMTISWVRRWVWWILQATVLRVTDEPDDLEPRIGEPVWKLLELRDVHALTDGIFVAEIFVGEGLVDDGELALPFHLGFGERAAVDELNFEDGEITFTAKLEERGPFFCVSLAGNFDVGVDATVGRKRAGFCGFKDAGYGFEQ